MRAAQFWGLCSLSDRVLPQLPQASRSATTINYTSSSCRQDQTFSTQGKTISKYCNISKTQGRGSINPPPPSPSFLNKDGGMILRVRLSIIGLMFGFFQELSWFENLSKLFALNFVAVSYLAFLAQASQQFKASSSYRYITKIRNAYNWCAQ